MSDENRKVAERIVDTETSGSKYIVSAARRSLVHGIAAALDAKDREIERWKREAMEWRLGFDAIASIRCMLYDGQMNQLTIGESASWRPALAAKAANTPATGEGKVGRE